MLPVLNVLGLHLPAYTVMILTGCACGLLVAERRRVLFRLQGDVILAAYLVACIGAFLGGKLFFVLQGILTQPRRFLTVDFLTTFSQAGLVFYGGMAGTLGGISAAARLLHENPWPLMDTLLPALPLAQTFGRIGCLLAGCCYGVPVSWGVWMDPASGAPADTALLPVQLLEALGTAGLCLLLLRIGSVRRSPGFLLGTYLVCYSILRFVLEFYRYDSIRGMLGPLSVAQWCSVAASAAGALLLYWSRRRLPAPLPHGS